MRSAGSELWNNPGDCSTREGRSARESAPLERTSDTKPLSFFDHILGSAARNDFNRNTLEAVKKSEYRFHLQAKDSVLLNPASPFLKGLTPKSMIEYGSDKIKTDGAFS